jgi:O-antigen/teichoic acid export membrane protein
MRGLRRSKGNSGTDATDDNPNRGASKRALITTADQGFSSLSNFAVGVVVARIAGPVGLGGFSLAYAFWLVLAALHRSLITDPMAIENDAVQHDAEERTRLGFASEVTMGVATAILLLVIGIPLYAAGQRTFGLALLAVSPWLPFLLLQDYWRWTGFMRRQPGKSLANDTVFNIIQGILFALLWVSHTHSIVFVIGSWGAGSVAGAVYGLWQFKTTPKLRDGIKGLRARWELSKWLAGNSLFGWASSQASVLLAGFILGPAGLGALRASQTLVQGPALVLIQAGGSVGLPEASRSLADRGWAGLKKVSIVISGAGMISVAIVGTAVFILGGPLLKWTYGPAFSHDWPAADLFAVAFLITSVGLGPILVLKTTRNTRSLFRVQLISLVVSVVAVSVLAVTDGVAGAAIAAIVTGIANMIGILYYGRRARNELLEQTDTEDPEGGSSKPGPVPDLGKTIDQIRNNDAPIAVEFG